MKQIFTLILMSVLISGCGIINDFLDDDMPTTTSNDEPPKLYLIMDGEQIEMNLGTYCWTGGDVGLCVDMIPPSYTQDEHITVNAETLTLQFEDPVPTSISAYVHPGSNLMTRIADIMLEPTLADDGTVSIPLHEQLSGNYVLVVSAFWDAYGDAMYTLPINIAQ